MKRDGYKFNDRWENWKKKHFKGIKGIKEGDHRILIDFLKDMENGHNTPAGQRGKRTSGTLLNLAEHNLFFLKNFKKDFSDLNKFDLTELEKKIENGKIKKRNGQLFKAFGNYIKDFKVFWHWWTRRNKNEYDEELRLKAKLKKEKNKTKIANIKKELKNLKYKDDLITDITTAVSSKTQKPSWVYLDEKQIKDFFNRLSFDYKVICFLMLDSGMRVTEANSCQVQSFSKDFTQLDISEESSKTFGRTMNLKLCSELLKEYVNQKKLKPTDYIFQKDLWTMNKYLKDNCGRMFGKDKVSSPKSKGLYGSFTLYDIRHNACCFWINRYPTHKGIMYRFGWKKSDKIDYYSGFLGVRDELSDADMITAEDKPKLYTLEKELESIKDKVGEFDEVLPILELLQKRIKANPKVIEILNKN